MQCREQWSMVCGFDLQDLQLKGAQSSSLSFGLRLVSMILPPASAHMIKDVNSAMTHSAKH